jgi:hypothetical protein
MSLSLATLYTQAQLALAAYANTFEGITAAELRQVLRDAGMGDAQARAFASEYRVVDQYDGKVAHTYVDDFGVEQRATLETGLSVTLFERAADGHRMVAVRGTEIGNLPDLQNDVLLALGVSKALSQQAALNAKVRSGWTAVASCPVSRSPGIHLAAFSRPA